MKLHSEEKIVNSQNFCIDFFVLSFVKKKIVSGFVFSCQTGVRGSSSCNFIFSCQTESAAALVASILAAMRRVGSVGIRSTVYRGSCGRQIFTSSSFRQKTQNGNNDNKNEY